jgi:hypothetical protein
MVLALIETTLKTKTATINLADCQHKPTIDALQISVEIEAISKINCHLLIGQNNIAQ